MHRKAIQTSRVSDKFIFTLSFNEWQSYVIWSEMRTWASVNEAHIGLSTELKVLVETKFEEGVEKPNEILSIINCKEITEPDKSKIVVYLRKLRKRVRCSNSLRVLNSRVMWWPSMYLNRWRHTIRTSTSYCCRFVEYRRTRFENKIVLSTPRLLRMLTYSELIQPDATYKLTWQGFPLLIRGCSDKNNVFHPLCAALCKSESSDDYAFIFDATRQHSVQ